MSELGTPIDKINQTRQTVVFLLRLAGQPLSSRQNWHLMFLRHRHRCLRLRCLVLTQDVILSQGELTLVPGAYSLRNRLCIKRAGRYRFHPDGLAGRPR